MGKKIEAPKNAGLPAVEKPSPATKNPAVAKEATVAPKAPAARKKAGPATARKATGKAAKSLLSTDDIALRAYFIAEKRQLEGTPGDSQNDWIEAERQLLAELKANNTKARKSAPASR